MKRLWKTALSPRTLLLLQLLLYASACYGVKSLRFLVIGDWGGIPIFPYQTPVETAVSIQMGKLANKLGTEFQLTLGDNFYFDGVKDVDDSRFKETFEDVYTAKSLQTTDWYMIAGNHDYRGNVSAEIAYSEKSQRWHYPDYYYSLTFPVADTGLKLHVLMLDTILLCGNTEDDFTYGQPTGPVDGPKAEAGWKWIEQQLKNSTAEYLIVAGHFPVWSIAGHGPTKCLVNRLEPLLHKYNVTAYLSGHDHNLQHLQYASSGHLMNYFVTGSGNWIDPSTAHKSDVPANSSKFYSANILELGGFAYVEITAKNVTYSFWNGLGLMIYTHTLKPRTF